MRTISETVTSIDLPDDASPDLKFEVSTLRMNAMTEEIRNHAMETAVKAFCRNVADAQAGRLDCSEAAIEQRRTLEIPEDEIPTKTEGPRPSPPT